jgi:TRAP-type transport system small permease protein
MTRILSGIDFLNKLVGYLVGIILMVMSVVISFQVFSRFVLNNSLEWSEELSRYLMIWLVFLAASMALRKGMLIGVEALAERMKFNKKRVLKTCVHIINIAFFSLIVFYGFEMLTHVKNQMSPAMKIPMLYPYAAIPVGGILFILNSVAVLIELYTTKEEK